MKIGVDSSVMVAGLHANHPLHVPAADWLIGNIDDNDLIAAHHSILETYAVLTRLPGNLRVTGAEARQLLEASIRPHIRIAAFAPESIWSSIDAMATSSAVGGQAYDAFIAGILTAAGVDAVATFNTAHFQRVAPRLRVIDPSQP